MSTLCGSQPPDIFYIDLGEARLVSFNLSFLFYFLFLFIYLYLYLYFLFINFDRKRCNRIKAIATLRLPEELADMPSMFFCMGPFGMFSNKGDRIGMTTYAPETNIAVTSSSGELEPEFSHMYFKFPEREKNLKGQRIVAGISKLIPDLRKAEVLKVNVGIVQTFMNEDTIDHGFQIGNLGFIHDPTKGGIHKRNYSGVEEPMPGYIINACMKLIYCFDNAKLVKDIMLRSLSGD